MYNILKLQFHKCQEKWKTKFQHGSIPEGLILTDFY